MNQIISLSSILAQVGTTQSVQSYFLNLIPDLFNLVKALVILLIGWLIAGLVRSLVVKLLNQTSIDNRIASWISSGRGDTTSTLPIEKWIGEGVFWLIILFTIIAALNALQLTAVSAPSIPS